MRRPAEAWPLSHARPLHLCTRAHALRRPYREQGPVPLLTTPKGTGGPPPLALANSTPETGRPPTGATPRTAGTPETQPPRGSEPRGGLVRSFGRKWLLE